MAKRLHSHNDKPKSFALNMLLLNVFVYCYFDKKV